MDRRKFIGTSVAAGAAACLGGGLMTSCGKGKEAKKIKVIPQTFRAPDGDIRGLYIMLGYNMWCQWPTEMMGDDMEAAVKLLPDAKHPDYILRCKDEYWREVVDHAAEKGINFLVVDLGEGLFFPSHPELAVEGSWSVGKMQEEIKRLNALGMEVIPKLNFSTMHNGWMKDYQHMVSSAPFYRMCEDVIKDACEIFGNPRFFHIGFDEEDSTGVRNQFSYVCQRGEENWWLDLLHIVRTVEANGARAMMWSDYGWDHPEFYERCPKTVVQCPWYYNDNCDGYDLETANPHAKKKIECFYNVAKAGFDVVGCGSNWVSLYKQRNGLLSDDVMGEIVKLSRKAVPGKQLLGTLVAPWDACDTPENVAHQISGINLYTDAL